VYSFRRHETTWNHGNNPSIFRTDGSTFFSVVVLLRAFADDCETRFDTAFSLARVSTRSIFALFEAAIYRSLLDREFHHEA